MSSLAAARADNFYYPPEWTPEQGSLNKFQGQHALRERAKKLDQGILVIRFEMPYHIWCGGCGSMIAQGVRFNAEKKQIGNYYSTKIWSFKMKSACCQHEIEIHTDPKNCDYVVVSGGKKKVVEYDAEDAGTTALPTDEERERLQDPLSKVEHLGKDRKKAGGRKAELTQIKESVDARHSDPYLLNRRLRAELRAQKSRVAAEEQDSRSKGLAIRLLPGTEDDQQGAALAVFRPKFEENRRDRRAAIRASSIFSQPSPPAATLLPAAAPSSLERGLTAGRGETDGAMPPSREGVAARVPSMAGRRSKPEKSSTCGRSAGEGGSDGLGSRKHHDPYGPTLGRSTKPELGSGGMERHQKRNRHSSLDLAAPGRPGAALKGKGVEGSALAAQKQRLGGISTLAKRSALAAKRRKIDAQGVLAVAAGRAV